MNEDMREPFVDVVAAFRKFAVDQGRPADLLWISQERVRVKLGSVWIFRPNELTNDDNVRRFYEAAREGDSSLKLIGIGELDGRYIAGVEEMRSPPHHPKMLYMSLVEGPRYTLRAVTNRLAWAALNIFPASRSDNLICDAIGLDHLIPMANRVPGSD